MKNRERIKALIQLSSSIEEANGIIEQETGYRTVKEKMAFLTGMFDFKLIDKCHQNHTSSEAAELMNYHSVLNAVMHEN